jgi:small subunit ribosomal protein S5
MSWNASGKSRGAGDTAVNDMADEKEVKKEVLKGEKTAARPIEQKIELPGREEPAEDSEVTPDEEEGEVVVEEKEKPREAKPGWIPKTQLGQRVLKGEFKTIEDVLKTGQLILEPEIVDYLVPDLKNEIIYIGGSPGKGGGIRRTATRRTVRMHKSGRRFKLSSVMVVGDERGVAGIGKASSREHKTAIEKALEQAKLNIIRVKKGCGSWECGCGEDHSIPFKTQASCGSVKVTLMPAPKGVGIVASDPVKKALKLAGVKDIWVKTSGNTHARSNLIYAVFQALKNLNRTKGDL